MTWPTVTIGLEAILGPGAGDRSDAPALLAPGGAGLRRAELAAQVAAVAAGLVARGVEPGDPIGIVGPNGPELAVALAGGDVGGHRRAAQPGAAAT